MHSCPMKKVTLDETFNTFENSQQMATKAWKIPIMQIRSDL